MTADIPWWVFALVGACGWLAYDIYKSTMKVIEMLKKEFNQEAE